MGTDATPELWHRFEEAMTNLPGDLNIPFLRHVTYTTFKKTPRGCWVKRDNADGIGNRYFIRYSNKRNIAHATEEDALRAFISTKQAQVARLEKQVDKVKSFIETAERQLPQGGK